MLFLKLNLPEEIVDYNKVGELTSAAVANAPLKLKQIGIPVSITGYQAPGLFLAFKLSTPDRALTTGEQLTLLRNLGFKTLPFMNNNMDDVDQLIRIKSQYEQYQPVWCSAGTGAPVLVPDIATINNVSWVIDAKSRLVKVLNTTHGCFELVDHRIPESFQRGLMVKVKGTVVSPYMTGPVTDPTPTHCPKCNNPLKSIQLSSDLPLVLKCTSSFCKLLAVSDTPHTEIEIEQEVKAEDSFREVVAEVAEFEVSEEPAQEPVIEPEVASENSLEDMVADLIPVLKIVNMEVDVPLEIEANLAVQIVTSLPEGETADYILTRTKTSVTRVSRNLAKASGIPLLSLGELEEMLNE